MNEELLKGLLTIAGGAMAGGLTNTLAIWMLFHPYKPPAVRGRQLRRLQGAIPKNQPRLATAIGRTVGTRLLTEEDLTRIFAQPEFYQAFDQKLDAFLHELLEVERGSLRELLGPEIAAEADRLAGELLEYALPRLKETFASVAFEDAVHARAEELAAAVSNASAGDVLTPDRQAQIRAAAVAWLERSVDGEAFRKTVADYVRGAADKLLASDATIQDIVPASAADTLERAVASYMPLAVQRLGKMLENPAARGRFEAAVHDLLHRFLGDLKFHQRVVARLVMNADTVDRVLDAIEVEGADRLARLLLERPVQDAMGKGISDAVTDFLRRPLNKILGNPDDPAVQGALDTVVDWIVELARSPGAQTLLAQRLDVFLEDAARRTWGELVSGGLPPHRISEWVVGAARSDVAEKACREAGRRLAAAALDRPIGRPGRLLPANAKSAVRRAAGAPLWQWLQSQIPAIVRKLDVSRRVEEKVLEFPVEKMEELVRRVTERELRTIVRLGYALGAFIGGLMVAFNQLLG